MRIREAVKQNNIKILILIFIEENHQSFNQNVSKNQFKYFKEAIKRVIKKNKNKKPKNKINQTQKSYLEIKSILKKIKKWIISNKIKKHKAKKQRSKSDIFIKLDKKQTSQNKK